MSSHLDGNRDALLDCSRPGALLFWFASGAMLALSVMSAYAEGDWPSLLRVGSENPMLERIERDLGPLSRRDPKGHDGQLYYLVARDPFGTGDTPEALATFDNNGPRYRYRRILFPALAGGFGLLSPSHTLFAMVALLVAAMGAMAVAAADLAWQLKVRGPVVFAAALNAGAVMSLLLLTADVLALALALGGTAFVLRARVASALIAFALAALTKEVYLLVPWAIAAWQCHNRRFRTALLFLTLPAIPVGAWSLWVWVTLPPTASAVQNVGVPMAGILEAIPIWAIQEHNRLEIWLVAFLVLTFAGAAWMVLVGQGGLLRWVVAAWLVLACCSTIAVWGKPNNAARVFAILWPLTVLLFAHRLRKDMTRTPRHGAAARQFRSAQTLSQRAGEGN